VAWGIADGNAQLDVRRKVLDAGLDPTAVIDRSYFHSVYFREPGGILFELATTGPGFTTDEPAQRLGEQLKLPPQLEPRRAEIETALMPIHLPYQSQPGYLEPNESPRPRDPLP
jgi:glyoxalase family protein